MTRQEAQQALEQGHKITHYYFSHEEFIYKKDERLFFEDGIQTDEAEFWNIRNTAIFDDRWEIKTGKTPNP